MPGLKPGATKAKSKGKERFFVAALLGMTSGGAGDAKP